MTAYDLPIIFPFSAEDIFQGVGVHICVDTIDEIVRRHDSPGVRFPNSNLKRTKVEFTESSLRELRVHRQSFSLLLVGDKIYSKVSTSIPYDVSSMTVGAYA